MGNKNIEHSLIGKAIGEELKSLKKPASLTWEELVPHLQDHVSVTQHPVTGFTVFWLKNRKVIWTLGIVLVLTMAFYFLVEKPKSKTIEQAPSNTKVQPAKVDTPKALEEVQPVAQPNPVVVEPIQPAAGSSGAGAVSGPPAGSAAQTVAGGVANGPNVTNGVGANAAVKPAIVPPKPLSTPKKPVAIEKPAAPPAKKDSAPAILTPATPSHLFPVLRDSVPD